MSTLSVSIIQADLHWHDAASNRSMMTDMVDALESPGDIVVLAEMFTTGFSMDAESLAEPMDGPSMQWLADTASRIGSAVCGSLIISDAGRYVNRFVFMHPDGSHEIYDKRHLFRLADEHEHYSAGSTRTVFDYKGFRVCPMVCYDLRFPVWSRNLNDYDLLLYVANWPSPRHNAWHTLIRARAIENQAFVAAVNRCGVDGNDLGYKGGSAIIDYLGQELADLGENAGGATAVLDLAALEKFRNRFPFHVDADRFELRD